MASAEPASSLVTSQKYSHLVYSKSGFHSIIRVQNISTEALVGGAMWRDPRGNERRNRLQPVSISASLALQYEFESAAQNDIVNGSTVNYSTLTEEILKVVESRQPSLPHAKDFVGLSMDWTLYELAEWLYIYLTGHTLAHEPPSFHDSRYFIEGGCPNLGDETSPALKAPLLDFDKLQDLEIRIFLPKATLLSSGVSLTTSLALGTHFAGIDRKVSRSVLKIHNLRIPTLIGINENERLAKQLVIVNVEVDPYVPKRFDHYNELEQIIVKSTEESSYGTLESLAAHLSARVIKHFIYAYAPHLELFPLDPLAICYATQMCRVRICLEKPCAITFADAPSIEIIRDADPNSSMDSKKLHEQWQQKALKSGVIEGRIPFPLQGTLSEWISTNCPGDTT